MHKLPIDKNTELKHGYVIKKYENLTLTRGGYGNDGIGYQDKQCLTHKNKISQFEADNCFQVKMADFERATLSTLPHANFFQREAIISRMYHKGIDNFKKTKMYKLSLQINKHYHFKLSKMPTLLKEVFIYEWLDDNQRLVNGKATHNHKFKKGFQIRLKDELRTFGYNDADFLRLIDVVEAKMKDKRFVAKMKRARKVYLGNN